MLNEERLRTQLIQKPTGKLKTGLRYKRLGAILFSVVMFAATTITISKAPQQVKNQHYTGDISGFFESAALSNKLCLIQFSSEYSYPSYLWEQEFIKNEEVLTLLEEGFKHIIISKESINLGDIPFWNQYGISEYPTMLVTDASGKEFFRFSGENTVQSFTKKLKKSLAIYRKQIPEISQNKLGEGFHSIEAADRSEDSADSISHLHKQKAFGLVMETLASFDLARAKAQELEKEWDKGIWIEKIKSDQFQVILGTFDSEEEAEVAGSFLRTLGGEETYITQLSLTPIQQIW